MRPVVWITGLSSSGKSTIAHGLAHELKIEGRSIAVLDADIIRPRLWPELGFSREDREKNIDRLGFLARFLSFVSIIPIVAAISPFVEARKKVRKSTEVFIEVFLRCPMGVLESRDSNGIYQKYRNGQIVGVAGLDFPYEESEFPELVIDTDQVSIPESIQRVLSHLHNSGI